MPVQFESLSIQYPAHRPMWHHRHCSANFCLRAPNTERTMLIHTSLMCDLRFRKHIPFMSTEYTVVRHVCLRAILDGVVQGSVYISKVPYEFLFLLSVKVLSQGAKLP